MNFKDQVIWITGASSGIGEALAIAFSKLDAELILSSRNLDKLEIVKAKCLNPEKIKVLKLDLQDYQNLDKVVGKALKLFNKIDILINNGGISQRSLAIDTGIAIDVKIFETNYFGTIALTKAILPYFAARNNGHIVVVTSVVGKIGTPLRSSYAASKHALHGFFDSLRAEVHKHHINITLICPGYVNTNVSKNALVADGSKQNTLDKATENGLSPTVFAEKMIKAIANKKQEVVIGGAKEKMAVFVKRYFPKLLAKMIRKINVT